MQVTGTRNEHADLEKLAAELTGRGLQADLCTPHGRLAYLHVRNPSVSVLSEKVYVQAEAFWFSWAEKIAGRDNPADAAETLARVLAAASNTIGE